MLDWVKSNEEPSIVWIANLSKGWVASWCIPAYFWILWIICYTVFGPPRLTTQYDSKLMSRDLTRWNVKSNIKIELEIEEKDVEEKGKWHSVYLYCCKCYISVNVSLDCEYDEQDKKIISDNKK